MNSFIALTRYSLSQNRMFLGICYFTCFVGLAISLLVRGIDGNDGVISNLSGGFASLAFWALILWSVALLGFNQRQSLQSANSMYDPLVLRLPLAEWQLYGIPLLMIAIWLVLHIGTAFTVAYVFAQMTGTELKIAAVALLGIVAWATWIIGVTWRPFTRDWHRLCVMVVLCVLLFAVIPVLVHVFDERMVGLGSITIFLLLFYLGGILFAANAVKRARISSTQQLNGRAATSDKATSSQYAPTTFVQPSAAMGWHDRTWLWRRNSRQSWVMLPVLACIGIAVPPEGCVVYLLCLGSMAALSASSQFEATVTGTRSSMPSYLAMLPVSNLELGRLRLKIFVQTYLFLFVASSPSLLLMTIHPANRETIASWWDVQSNLYGWYAPPRIGAAVYLGVMCLCLGLAIRAVCVQWYGRQWLVIALKASVAIILPSITGMVCIWFLKQSSWEGVKATEAVATKCGAPAIITLLAAKCIWLLRSVRLATRYRLHQWSLRMLSGWVCAVVACTVVGYLLWPTPTFQLHWILAASVLAIPISPLILAPIAITENRHRRLPTSTMQIQA